MSGPVRTFDYAEAKRLRAAGETYAAIGRRFGVTPEAARLAVRDDVRARALAASAAWQAAGRCPDCGAPATRHSRTWQLRCRDCAVRAQTTSVRETELLCMTCREWKPDAAFARNRTEPQRRGRHDQCTPCNTAAKRAWRQRRAAEGSRANA